MAKNDPRSQIPAPVVTVPGEAKREALAAQVNQAVVAPTDALGGGLAPGVGLLDEASYAKSAKAYAPPALAITELAARAITNGAAMAREYAAAAGELCRTADTHPQGRANARRLLRLALAHLET